MSIIVNGVFDKTVTMDESATDKCQSLTNFLVQGFQATAVTSIVEELNHIPSINQRFLSQEMLQGGFIYGNLVASFQIKYYGDCIAANSVTGVFYL